MYCDISSMWLSFSGHLCVLVVMHVCLWQLSCMHTHNQKRLTDDFSCYCVYCRLFSTRYRNKHRGQLRIKQIDVGRNQPPVGDRFMAHYNYKLAPDISEYVRYRKHDRHGFYTLIECPELEQNDE